MTLPSQQEIIEVVEATWPPAASCRLGPWTIRDGAGGGKRVSAATANGQIQQSDIQQAETAMADLGQTPLFMIRPGDEVLDGLLDLRGYRVIDPVTAYACPTAVLMQDAVEPMTGVHLWPPVASQKEIWENGGICPARLDVMHRAPGPKAAILGRIGENAAGTGFVAVHRGIAMLHALEVAPAHRRKGVGGRILQQAACWAQDHGAEWTSLVTTSENLPSNALYRSVHMSVVGKYHYRGSTLS